MKKLISATLLILCCQFSFAEKAVIDHIVYYLDLRTLTARVINFQTSKTDLCDVTIPSTIVYKNDTYTVTALSYDKLDYNYDLSYNYEKARLNIEHVYLPNTLEEIWWQAFSGMSRLRELDIPESVHTIYAKSYVGMMRNFKHHTLGVNLTDELSRLESLTVRGTPTCYWDNVDGARKYTIISRFDYENREWKEIPYDLEKYNYILEVAYTLAGIESLSNPTSNICPNLKTFSMPAAEKKIRPLKQWYSELRTSCNSYNAQLKEHPYFDGSKITYKLDYKDDQTQLKHDFDSVKSAMSEQFSALMNGQMENNMRNNNLPKYLEIYLTLHPELQPSIDSLHIEYRCENSARQDSIILQFIEHEDMPLSCRESQYQQFQHLFSNRAEFDELYYREPADSFLAELTNRAELRPWLDKFMDLVKTNPDAKLQGMTAAKEGSISYRTNAYLRKFKGGSKSYYEQALNTLFEHNEKLKAEYAKNGHYFSNREDFFNAYIEPDYKSSLKEIKKMQ